MNALRAACVLEARDFEPELRECASHATSVLKICDFAARTWGSRVSVYLIGHRLLVLRSRHEYVHHLACFY